MKKRILFCLMVVFILTGCGKGSLKEADFEKGLKNYIESEENTYGYEAKVDNGEILVTYDEEDYVLTYNLKDNPVITYEVEIEKGISYDEYSIKTDALSLPMLGYFATLDVYGVDVLDSTTYFYQTYFNGMMDSIDYEKETYIVVDDADEVETDANIILTSEFGDKVIEFIEYNYEKDLVIKDNDNDTYTYEVSATCGDESCVLTAKLTVNSEGNFDKIVGYADELAKESMDEDITSENADYHIELVVGQTINISGKKLSGYELSGMDIVDVESLDSDYTFYAKKSGVANGKFYIGEDSEDVRTFYITVNESNNNDIDDISLTIK